jgi:hypothetical protein
VEKKMDLDYLGVGEVYRWGQRVSNKSLSRRSRNMKKRGKSRHGSVHSRKISSYNVSFKPNEIVQSERRSMKQNKINDLYNANFDSKPYHYNHSQQLKLYSKNMYKDFKAMKSVLKPRMYHHLAKKKLQKDSYEHSPTSSPTHAESKHDENYVQRLA